MGDDLRKALVVLAVIAIIFLIGYATVGYWLSSYGHYLVVDEEPRKCDTIVVLSGGGNVSRVTKGVELYQKGYSSRIIMSGGGNVTSKFKEADLMSMEAQDQGVPFTSILLESESKSTYDNAVYVKNIIQRYNLKSILLVTSNYHTRRAKYIFEEVFKNTSVEIITVSAPDSEFSPSTWWKNHEGQQRALTELANLIIYRIKY